MGVQTQRISNINLYHKRIIYAVTFVLHKSFIFFQGPLIIKDNETLRYTLIGVASVAHGSLVNRTVVATYARINQVLPWIYSFIYDIEYEEEIITSKSLLYEE